MLMQRNKNLFIIRVLFKGKLYKYKSNYPSIMKLTKEDKELIDKAKALVGQKKVSGGVVKEIGTAPK